MILTMPISIYEVRGAAGMGPWVGTGQLGPGGRLSHVPGMVGMVRGGGNRRAAQ